MEGILGSLALMRGLAAAPSSGPAGAARARFPCLTRPTGCATFLRKVLSLMGKVNRFGVSIPRELVKAFDARIRSKGYRTRSEAVRDMMRDYLVGEEWQAERGQVVGTVTIVYDHHTRELTHVLTELQHRFHAAITCTTHVHLGKHNCLEVIVVKGRSEQVRAIADLLISTKGVKHGKLVCTTTGKRLA
jgi:CopG family nickel-responsive transcriptional regulator